jgi:hypothetical protein
MVRFNSLFFHGFGNPWRKLMELGRAIVILPSGAHDIGEDVATGYGGESFLQLLKQDGFFELPGLFPS